MKREIKFRGKRLDNGELVYGDLLQNGSICHVSNFDNEVNREHYEVDPKTVGQYTGLKDKNGKEIYEWDLDKSGLFIRWSQLYCCFGLFSALGYQKEIIADIFDNKGKAPKEWMNSNIEVIGNMFDNPELI